MYRLFSWEHSYFSGKVRAYLRHKDRASALGEGFEDILATPELIQGLLTPRSGSGAVPQLQAPDGTWIQDSSEIIDYCEAAHPDCPVVPDAIQEEMRQQDRMARREARRDGHTQPVARGRAIAADGSQRPGGVARR